MNCSEVQNRLAEYVTDEASSPLIFAIEDHLTTCDACRDWHREVLALAEIWEQDKYSQPGLDLVTPVMQRLHQGSEQDVSGHMVHTPPSLSFWHFGLAACLTLFLFDWGIFEHVGLEIHKINAQVSFILQEVTHK